MDCTKGSDGTDLNYMIVLRVSRIIRPNFGTKKYLKNEQNTLNSLYSFIITEQSHFSQQE